MAAVESVPLLGSKAGSIRCTGYCQQLASFENRVYEIEFDEPLLMPPEIGAAQVRSAKPNRAVVKFYRPGRWTRDQILDEHDFMLDLVKEEVPVVAPYFFDQPGITLKESDDLFFCVYPKVGGRQPEDLNEEQLKQLGRLIARMHGVGRAFDAEFRMELTPQVYGQGALDFLLSEKRIVPDCEQRFADVVRMIIDRAEERFEGQPLQRIHGDCHAGNILWNEKLGPFFIDFDDMVLGPPVQDLWLLCPDEAALKFLIAGYQEWAPLPPGSLALVEPLRALRMIHYATWIAKRYNDPAFKLAFPQFESPIYWENLTRDLQEQLVRMVQV